MSSGERERQIRRVRRAERVDCRRGKGSGRIDNGACAPRAGRPCSRFDFPVYVRQAIGREPDGVHRICRALPEGRQSYLSNAKGKVLAARLERPEAGNGWPAEDWYSITIVLNSGKTVAAAVH